MKTLNFGDNVEEWMQAREGRITGSKVKDIISKTGIVKKGYYQLLADRLAEPADDEKPIDRGKRLEPEAIKAFEKKFKKKVNTDLVIWVRNDNENIVVSPDALVSKTVALEVKCLNSANHIEVLITQAIPKELIDQIIQYLVVNDDLRKVICGFYDPRVTFNPFFVIEIERKNVEEQIEASLNYQRRILRNIDEVVNKFSKF